MRKIALLLLLILVQFGIHSSVHAQPSDEVMDCLVDKIITDCKDHRIYGDCKQDDGSQLVCGKMFSNEDKTGVKSYISEWMIDWEKQGNFVQYSPSPFGCLNGDGNGHAFRVDSAFAPQWDGKAVSCPAKVENWTVFGFSLNSYGGITIVGFSIFGPALLGSILTLSVLIKKKRVNIWRYSIVVKNQKEPEALKEN